MKDTWIWLPRERYPAHQTTSYDCWDKEAAGSYTVAEFEREYHFDRPIERVHLRFGGDTELQLYANGRVIATGPPAVGGDFLGKGAPRDWHYAWEMDVFPEGDTLVLFARVKMRPVRMCEFSRGHGGFMLNGEVFLAGGGCKTITTDATWLARRNGAYRGPLHYDGAVAPDAYGYAEEIEDIWHVEVAPIPVRSERELPLATLLLAPDEVRELSLPLDMIYAGFASLKVRTDGAVTAELTFRELEGEAGGRREAALMVGEGEYRGFYLHSAGCVAAKLTNSSKTPSQVEIGFIATSYPVTVDAETRTSDAALNEVLRVCKHTLRYCRQTHHLDSPMHCEPLACTGDYYIESLMTAFSFGDQRLCELDLVRTARQLCAQNGRMFHTTYSLIWVRMLYDTYMMGGNAGMLSDCRRALDLLLARFASYVGDSGLVENPPDYMFVDWIYIDGLSMHHPPRCLGQTVLNMLYFMALRYAARLYTLLDAAAAAADCEGRAAALREAINSLLYDKERGLYFEGLNTPSREEDVYVYHPQNEKKRYYLKHSNIMAAYTSVCDDDTAVRLIERVMADEVEGEVQPYFLHYLLEAIFTHGLRERYTLRLLERWKPAVADCGKGLVEGFLAPEPTYWFDHSHAWGGSPLWSLPRALLGLVIKEPGFRRISLSPSLLGLSHATVELPTPFGMVVFEMEHDRLARITAPPEVTVVWRENTP